MATAPVTTGFVFPPDLFDPDGAGTPCFWSCVRTRPRWEKKLALWLAQRQWPFFLPVVERMTCSHRHRRVTRVPLFAGYVFVVGEHAKRDFVLSGTVVRVLKPETERQSQQLHLDLWNVWRAIESRELIDPVTAPPPRGAWCEVIAGPMRGVQGRYQRRDRQGGLMLSVDMLGLAVMVVIPPEQVRPVG